jgi:4-oxalocrotonate tautomerase
MPTVRIDLLEGRTPEQKKKLAEAITEDFVRILGVDSDRVTVIFNNLAKHDLAKGGVPATEWK